MAQQTFSSIDIPGFQDSYEGGTLRTSVSFVACGLMLGALIAWLLVRFYPHDCDCPIALSYLIAALSGLLIVSLFVGVPIARLVLALPMSLLNSYLNHVQVALQEYSRQSKWPGRQFLDVLRYSKLASVRREFVVLGLDTHLRVSNSVDFAEIERVSSILHVLQSEVAARGRRDLSAVAREARSLLRSLIHANRLRFGLIWLVYFLVPAAASFVGALWLERLTSPKTLAITGLSRTVLSMIFFAAAPLVTYLGSQLLFFLTWNLGKSTETKVDDVLLLVGSWAVGGIGGISSLFYSLVLFRKWPIALQTGTRAFLYLFVPMNYEAIAKTAAGRYWVGLGPSGLLVLRAAVILGLTALLIVLLRGLCNRVLREIAARTKQKYDDMMVELVRIFGTFILAALGVGWVFMIFIAEYGAGGTSSEGAGPLMPYALLVAVAGGLLGIGSRDMLENFFAGISMQIDKPFEPSERVVLEDGAVCEVRSVGMRSTHFYNILENTDLYVPNTKLAQQTVSNLSRPDREYRRTLKIFVRDEQDSLILAEGLMLFAAFSVDGIDVPTIVDEQFEKSLFQKNRRGIAAEFSKLQEHYDEAASATIKLHGQLVPVGELVRDKCRQLSTAIRLIHGRREYFWDSDLGRPRGQLFNRDKDELHKEAMLAHEISYRLYELAMCFWTLGASYPTLRADLEHLTLELLRAPSVKSHHRLTEEGLSVWELELMVYAQLTEQSDEILHNLNVFIQQLLSASSLLPRSDGGGRSESKPKAAEPIHQ